MFKSFSKSALLFLAIFSCSFANAQETTLSSVAKTQDSKATVLDDKLLVIGTGAITGIYYPAGSAICRLINKDRQKLGLRCAVESTSGSVYNLNALKNANLELAIVQSDWQEHAFNGTAYFAKGGKIENLRHVMSLHSEAFTIITQKSSKINKLDDLKGTIVNVGPEGSGGRATMEDLMKAKGWSKNDFKSLAEYKPSDQARMLCDGRIDAIIMLTGHPSASMQEITTACETKIIEANDDVVNKLVAANPELSNVVIPGGMYVGVPNDIQTFGVRATLVTTTDISDDVIYKITKTVFEHLDSFKMLHPIFSDLDKKKMAQEGRTAPYHEGALKYYKETGIQIN